jgi:hypothetical protein
MVALAVPGQLIGAGVAVGDGVNVGVAVGHVPGQGVGVTAAAVTEPPWIAIEIVCPVGSVRIVSLRSTADVPSAATWKCTVAMTPVPLGPAGGSEPSVPQENSTLLAVTTGETHRVERPVVPRNTPSLAPSGCNTPGSTAIVNWNAPRSATLLATMPTSMSEPVFTIWFTGCTHTAVDAPAQPTGNDTGVFVGGGVDVGDGVGQAPGHGVAVAAGPPEFVSTPSVVKTLIGPPSTLVADAVSRIAVDPGPAITKLTDARMPEPVGAGGEDPWVPQANTRSPGVIVGGTQNTVRPLLPRNGPRVTPVIVATDLLN